MKKLIVLSLLCLIPNLYAGKNFDAEPMTHQSTAMDTDVLHSTNPYPSSSKQIADQLPPAPVTETPKKTPKKKKHSKAKPKQNHPEK